MQVPPKEKADELFTTYHNKIQVYGDDLGQESLVSILAIKCSLIAVNEIIDTLNFDIKDLDVRGSVLIDLIHYWRSVKEEIEKL